MKIKKLLVLEAILSFLIKKSVYFNRPSCDFRRMSLTIVGLMWTLVIVFTTWEQHRRQKDRSGSMSWSVPRLVFLNLHSSILLTGRWVSTLSTIMVVPTKGISTGFLMLENCSPSSHEKKEHFATIQHSFPHWYNKTNPFSLPLLRWFVCLLNFSYVILSFLLFSAKDGYEGTTEKDMK